MSERIDFTKKNWWSLIPKEEIEALEKAGYGRKLGLGQHPVLLVIDVQYVFVGENSNLIESVKKYPASSGSNAYLALANIQRIISSFREWTLPVIYTKSRPFAKAIPAVQKRDFEIVEEIKPRCEDCVIEKYAPSAFHGTRILQVLNSLKADTLVVTGGSASGCVRATVVDAFSYGYKTAVIPEAIFDRVNLSQEIALFDIWLKYGDIMNVEEIQEYIKGITGSIKN